MKQGEAKGRNVLQRIYVEGELRLETPAHFGNGDSEAITDIPLLRDSLEPTRPLLTGASIAGALRNYLREHQLGYGAQEEQTGELEAEKLFGHLVHEVDDNLRASVESWLMVDDALGTPPTGDTPVEIRDGVAIDAATRTATEGHKYDIELLAAGTTFPLSFELWVPAQYPDLKQALAIALKGFENGRIGLGMRKRRGFGQCRVARWRVWEYPMDEQQGVLDWLTHESQPERAKSGSAILQLLNVNPDGSHAGEEFVIDARFRIRDSLLIRSDSGDPELPDMVHLRSARPGRAEPVPIVSGTSLAGAIRARAFRIANTLMDENQEENTAQDLIDDMFGKRIEDAGDAPTGSRVLIREAEIDQPIADRVQSRVKIDRFTGGAYPQALFSQQPVFARTSEPTTFCLHLELRKQVDMDKQQFNAEVGLLLLVLKDLWTGDLPIGGESSVGRGRLEGEFANLTLNGTTWQLQAAADGSLRFAGDTDIDRLEQFVQALQEYFHGATD